MLQSRLDHPHDTQSLPGGKRYELGIIRDSNQLAASYIAASSQIAEFEDYVLEDVVSFYVDILNPRFEATAPGGIVYLERKTITDLIAKAEKAAERIGQVLKGKG